MTFDERMKDEMKRMGDAAVVNLQKTIREVCSIRSLAYRAIDPSGVSRRWARY